MSVSIGLHRFVSVCTSSFCSTIIGKEFMVIYRYGENTGTKTGTRLMVSTVGKALERIHKAFVKGQTDGTTSVSEILS